MSEGVEAIIAAVLAVAPRGQQSAALCTKGEVFLAIGDLATALACFDRALRIDVSFPAAWVGRAVVLSERKRDNEALGCIHRALDVDPRCAAALVHKGHILRGRGQHLDALAAYEAALGSGAQEDAHAGRAAMLRALGRTGDSGSPAPVVAAHSSRPPVREKKKSARKSGRVDPRAEKVSIRQEARDAKKKSARRDPRAERTSFATDPLLAKKEDPAIALRPPESAPSSPPRRSSTRVPVASGAPHALTQGEEDLAAIDEVRALCLAGRHVEGLRQLEPIAKRCPSSREVWTLRGQILFSLKQYNPALTSIDRVTKLDPRDQDALKLMVRVLAATGKDVRALETAERLVALAPDDPEVHRMRADCLVAALRHVDAIAAYERVIQYVPDDPSAWLSLGRTLRQLRRVGEARMALTRGLSLAEGKRSAELIAQARELLARLPPTEG